MEAPGDWIEELPEDCMGGDKKGLTGLGYTCQALLKLLQKHSEKGGYKILFVHTLIMYLFGDFIQYALRLITVTIHPDWDVTNFPLAISIPVLDPVPGGR